jgi:hypothetical protein
MLATPLKLELCKQTHANTKGYQWPSVVIAVTTILEVRDFKWRTLGSVTVKKNSEYWNRFSDSRNRIVVINIKIADIIVCYTKIVEIFKENHRKHQYFS